MNMDKYHVTKVVKGENGLFGWECSCNKSSSLEYPNHKKAALGAQLHRGMAKAMLL